MVKKHVTTDAYVPSFKIVYEQSWELYKEKLWTLIGINAPLFVLSILYSSLAQPSFTNNNSFESGTLSVLISIIFLVLSIVTQGALLYAITEKKTVLQAFQKGWNITLPLLWVYILSFIRIIVGLLLLIIPGIYLSVKYFFADFVLLVEGKKGMAALSQSAEYVKGRWWKLFGIIAVTIVCYWPFYAAIALIPGFSVEIRNIFNELFVLIVSPLLTIVYYVLYTHIKSAKR